MKNLIRKSLILAILAPALSFASSSSIWLPTDEGMAISGKIHALKKSKKYRSEEKCRAFAEQRSEVIAYTFDHNNGTCTTFTTVRSRPAKVGATSQLKV